MLYYFKGDSMEGINILIDIKNMYLSTEIQIDCKENKMWVKGREVEVDIEKFITKLFFITADWEDEYLQDVLDAEDFSLYITDGEKSQKVHCKGRYPANYGELKELLMEIVNG